MANGPFVRGVSEEKIVEQKMDVLESLLVIGDSETRSSHAHERVSKIVLQDDSNLSLNTLLKIKSS